MATNFPTSLDTLTNPTSSDSLSSPSHASQHANVNDAVEALQAKVGVDGSTVATSMDRKLPRGLMAENSTPTTFTATATPTTVLACSFTAQANRLYKFTFVCQSAMASTSGSRMQMTFVDDLGNQKGKAYQGSLVYGNVLTFTNIDVLTAGSRTISLVAFRDAGSTAAFYADAFSPLRLWVEDLGPY